MIAYYFTIILLLPVIVLSRSDKVVFYNDRQRVDFSKFPSDRYCSVYSIAWGIWLLYVMLLLGLRGNVFADYWTYYKTFEELATITSRDFLKTLTVKSIFSMDLEPGYLLLNFIISRFSSWPVVFFVVCAMIICIPCYKMVRAQSIPWLAALLWLSVGAYLEGFNIMRQVMAISILAYSYKYAVERKFWRFVLIVAFATTFHSLSVLMIFVYFFPLIKPSRKVIVLPFCLPVFFDVLFERLVVKANDFFHFASNEFEVMAMIQQSATRGFSALPVLLICILSITLFFLQEHANLIDIDSAFVRLSFWGTLVWGMLYSLISYSSYIARIASLFFMFPCLLLPYLIDRIRNKKQKFVVLVATALMLVFWFIANIEYNNVEYALFSNLQC